MDSGADSGDIISQSIVIIDDQDSARTLYNKFVKVGMRQIEEFLPQLISGSYKRIRQDEAYASYWRKRSKVDGKIDWRMPAQSIERLVRALSEPYPGAYFIYDGQEVIVWRAKAIMDEVENIEPGKVIALNKNNLVIKCSVGSISLLLTDPKIALRVGEYL